MLKPETMVEAVCAFACLRTLEQYGIGVQEIIATGPGAIIATALACDWGLHQTFDLCRHLPQVQTENFKNALGSLANTSAPENAAFAVSGLSGELLVSADGELDTEALQSAAETQTEHDADEFRNDSDETVIELNTCSISVDTSIPGKLSFGMLSDHITAQRVAGELWKQGVRLTWGTLYKDRAMRRVSLPAYSFEKTRCWVDIPSQAKSSNYDVAL